MIFYSKFIKKIIRPKNYTGGTFHLIFTLTDEDVNITCKVLYVNNAFASASFDGQTVDKFDEYAKNTSTPAEDGVRALNTVIGKSITAAGEFKNDD